MKRVYWDSCCFIDYLQGSDRGQQVTGVLQRAARGEIEIVTSAITLVEVLGDKRANAELREIIKAAMKPENGIVIVDLTRHLAEEARDFIWEHDYHKHVQDAVHIATATYVHRYTPIDEIHTFDQDILRFDGKLEIPVVEPSLQRYPEDQRQLPFGDE